MPRFRKTPFQAGTLKLEILLHLILCLLAAILVFGLLVLGFIHFILPLGETKFMDTGIKRAVLEFQDYITAGGISSGDSEAIETWDGASGQYIVLPSGELHQNRTAKPVPGSGGKNRNNPGLPRRFVTVTFSDGEAAVMILHTGIFALRNLGLVFSLLISFLVFFVLFYIPINRKIHYIVEIEQGVSLMESGGLDRRVLVKGRDELSRLAESINAMAGAIGERIAGEERSAAANRELVGELSHDIRTPLTVFLGFIPLLKKNAALPDEHREYLDIMENKAEVMRRRTGELLDYATLSSGQQQPDMAGLAPGPLLDQFAAELACMGEVRRSGSLPEGLGFRGDPRLLSRIFDNLLSNMRNYADLGKPLDLKVTYEGGFLVFEVANAVKPQPNAGGTSLGLRISAFIMEQHGGRMETLREAGHFRTRLIFPAAPL